jgi:hypothetical protein
MKIYLNKEFFNVQDLNGFTEIPFIVPYMNESTYTQLTQLHNIWNESLFTKLFFTGRELFDICDDVKDCDYSVLPFKYNESDKRVEVICNNAAKFNKQVIGIYNDDNEFAVTVPDNLILLRTSIGASTIKHNERVCPVFVPDHFNDTYNVVDRIGFCGYGYPYRRQALDIIKDQYNTDIIYRDGFFGGSMSSKVHARREYYSNLCKNKYTFCMRGAGNFSYRFYEALSFGRIPVLIETDTILPLHTKIDWSDHIITVDNNINSISNIRKKIEESNISMHNNRALWEKYFTPQGFIRNLHDFL